MATVDMSSWEQDVVWERLCAVDGNTDFLRGDFTSFAGRSVMADALTAASLAQEAFSSLLPPAGTALDASHTPCSLPHHSCIAISEKGI